MSNFSGAQRQESFFMEASSSHADVAPEALFAVVPEFAWVNVDEHRFLALILPGQGEPLNEEHSEPPLFRPSQPGKDQHEDLMHPPPEHCHQWREYAPLWSSLPWPDPWSSLPSTQIPEEP